MTYGDSTYSNYLESLAEEAAHVGQDVEEVRRWLREDPSWGWARMELHEDRGAQREWGLIIGRLQTRYRAPSFDALAFAEWLWSRHVHTNEERSTLTGHHQRAAHGAHHVSAEALRLLRAHAGIEYDDYADDPEVVST